MTIVVNLKFIILLLVILIFLKKISIINDTLNQTKVGSLKMFKLIFTNTINNINIITFKCCLKLYILLK